MAPLGYLNRMFTNAKLEDVRTFSLLEHGGDYKLSDNFTLWEFRSRDGADIVLVHPALVVLLQKVRNHFGKPIKINSAYRTESHNLSEGGRPNSAHLLGMAADIVPNWSVDLIDLHEYLETLNPGGLGKYNTFRHVDVKGEDRRWDNRT
jgi:uncharacterized protein YcbK (DUF882 family)